MRALVLALAAAAATQAPPPPDASRPAPDAVVIDVIATDARGQAVQTLKASDFVLREDGEVQPIEDVRFVKVDENGRLFAIYLDDYYISAGNTREVRDTLHRFVDQDLGPGDLVARK